MLKYLNNMKFGKKLGLFVWIFILGFLIFGVISYISFSTVRVNGPIYNNIMMGNFLIADVLPPPQYIVESYLVVHEITNEKDPVKISLLIEKAKSLENDFNKTHLLWENKLTDSEIKKLILVDSYGQAKKFYDVMNRDFFDAIQKNDKVKALSIVNGEMKNYYEEHRTKILEVVKWANAYNLNEENKAKESIRFSMLTIAIAGIAVFISCFIMWYFLKRSIKPMLKVTEILKNISEGEGDLTRRITIESKDEIGDLSKYFNKFIDKVQDIIRNIYVTTAELGVSSGDLLHVSKDLETSIESASQNINQIAAAAQEMTASTMNLASSSEQTSAGVTSVSDLASSISNSINVISNSSKDVSHLVSNVASSIKEINVSLGEVSKNCERSIHITSNASVQANSTNAIINKLDVSSKQIEKIVNVINDIADQTNMLALNAAIEAVGAGEAGKGFAVVANEVKELAKQTADATDEIGEQIENMQQNMSDAVKAMEIVTEVVNEISIITNTIARAVTEQSGTTNGIMELVVKSSDRVTSMTKEISEVASNSHDTAAAISEASKGSKEIAQSATEISSASNDVSRNIEWITGLFQGDRIQIDKSANSRTSKKASSQSTNSIAAGASKTNDMANDLSKITKKLEMLVRQFKV